MKKLITFSFMFLVAVSLTAQDFNRAKMDSLFSVIDENDKGMGSLSIFKDGKEIYSNVIGFADVEKAKIADASTKYRVGSISKTFTAVLVMQLVEEEKLRLDDRLSRFYPQIPNAEKITIENLLRHESGLYEFSKVEDFKQWKGQKQTKENLLGRFVQNGIVSQPGDKFEYCNTNYVLLSYIVEDLEKKPFLEVLQQRILKPLDLKNTYFGGSVDPARGEALSYQQTGEWTRIDDETEMTTVMGAGALSSTPADLNKFYSALFSGKIVEPASLEKMIDIKAEYGLGIFKMPLVGKTFYGHTGGIDGFNAVVIYLPEENVGISFSSNARDMAPHKILEGVAHIYFGAAYELPSFKTIALTAEELKQFEGRYSGEGFPLILKIYQENGKLMGQAEGQPSFPLEAYETNKFKFERMGLKLEFDPAAGKMLFKQGSNAHELKKA